MPEFTITHLKHYYNNYHRKNHYCQYPSHARAFHGTDDLHWLVHSQVYILFAEFLIITVTEKFLRESALGPVLTRKNILLRSSAKELFTVCLFPRIQCSPHSHLNSPSQFTQRGSPRRTTKFLCRKANEKRFTKNFPLADERIRARLQRAGENSAFYARWAKTRASAACASISP